MSYTKNNIVKMFILAAIYRFNVIPNIPIAVFVDLETTIWKSKKSVWNKTDSWHVKFGEEK